MSAVEYSVAIDGSIIDRIQEHNSLYDKSLDEYHTKFRDERPAVLKSIAKDISEQYNIPFDETKLWSRWIYSLRKFKDEHKVVEQHQPSGSGQSKRKSSWPLYEDMVWVAPFVEHLVQLSNDTMQASGVPPKFEHNFKRRCNRSKDENDVSSMQLLLQQNDAMMKKLEKELEEDNDSECMRDYFPLVSMRHKLLPEEMKYECTKQILAYIQFFREKKEKEGGAMHEKN